MPSEVKEVKGIAKPQRWDLPFWQERSELDLGPPPYEMTDAVLELILSVPPFSQMDPEKFSEAISLRGLLQNDTRIRQFKKGEIVVRQGDYGSSAFFILSGAVRVILDKLDEALIGRRLPQRKSFFGALKQLWSNPTLPETRNYESLRAD